MTSTSGMFSGSAGSGGGGSSPSRGRHRIAAATGTGDRELPSAVAPSGGTRRGVIALPLVRLAFRGTRHDVRYIAPNFTSD